MTTQPAGVRILGPTLVVAGGESLDPGGRKAARVLAVLALTAGERISTERLIDLTWGEAAPRRARESLQMHIAKLRKLLAPTPIEIETVAGGYRLVAPPGAIDVEAFIRLVDDAKVARNETRWTTAADRSARALALWQGDRIETLSDVASLSGEITALFEARRQARLIHAEALLATGDHESAVAELEDHVTVEPFVERFWELLMVGLYRSGRQSDALATYQRVASLLREELGIDPGPALVRLEEQILTQDPSLLAAAPASRERSELPRSSTPLVGRGHELARVADLLERHRLVSILGPGGVGKTSLALEAGHRLTADAADGGLFIDLTVCDGDDDVAPAALQQLGLSSHDRPLEAVIEHLRSRSMVMVVDNCEHVVTGASRLISALMGSCPDLLLIATSRNRLDTGGSTLLLSPLRVPPPGTHPASANEYPALRLFIERAQLARPGLDVTQEQMGLLGDICRTLDGLPLALMLVAAWANVLTITDIGERLGDSGLLQDPQRTEGDRHGRLEDAIAWSYRLLSLPDRSAFERLSVFRSAFDLDDAAAVLDQETDETLGTVAGLVDASLVVADVSGRSARYRMLETIRAFGLQRLAARQDRQEVLDRYRRHIVAVADAASQAANEADAFDRLHDLLPDLRGVLDWATAEEPQTVADLAGRLRTFWIQRGLASEIEPRLESVMAGVDSAAAWYTLGVLRYARGAFDQALAAFEAGLEARCELLDRARITNAMGVIALERGDYATAADRYGIAEQLFSEAGHQRGIAAARLNQGIADLNLGHYDQATDHLESARDLFHEQGDGREEGHALVRLAFLAELEGRSEVAVERANAALRIVRGLGPGLALADTLQYAADFETGAGNSAVARRLLAEAVPLFVALPHPPGFQRAMITASAIAVADEQWPEAAEMSAYAAQLRRDLGIPVPAANRSAVDRIADAINGSVPFARREALAERARLADIDHMASRCLDVLTRSAADSAQELGDHVMTTSE